VTLNSHETRKGQRWLRRALLGLSALAAAVLAWGFWLEPRRLVVTRHELSLSGWPAQLSGMRVALLADLHVGSPGWDVAALGRLVERTNAEQPELVLLAGDYQINEVPGGRWVGAEEIAKELGRLRAPLGVIAVLGNHDWWNDGERTRKAFTAAGITVLEDSVARLRRNDAPFAIVGLADQITRTSNPVAAFAGAGSVPRLLLVHEPDIFAEFPRLGLTPALTVAGHTHGGQVWLPLLGRRVVPSAFGERYAYGHVIEQGRHLFVTSGVGTSMLPVRFLVPPEIAMLTLRSQ
jgi:predicted MPP superfamily phosphohydrolase